MRLLLATILAMGALVLALEFLLVDVARRVGKAPVPPVSVTFAPAAGAASAPLQPIDVPAGRFTARRALADRRSTAGSNQPRHSLPAAGAAGRAKRR